MEDSNPVQLLWTGGWDSTYRLLTLLLDHRVPVRPIYVVDPTRTSGPTEQRVMNRIRTALFEHHPHTRALLQPTVVVSMSEIAPDATVSEAYDRIVAHNPLFERLLLLLSLPVERYLDDGLKTVSQQRRQPVGSEDRDLPLDEPRFAQPLDAAQAGRRRYMDALSQVLIAQG